MLYGPCRDSQLERDRWELCSARETQTRISYSHTDCRSPPFAHGGSTHVTKLISPLAPRGASTLFRVLVTPHVASRSHSLDTPLLGGTPLDERSARRRHVCLATPNIHKRPTTFAGGILPRSPSKEVATDLLRPRGHRHRPNSKYDVYIKKTNVNPDLTLDRHSFYSVART